MPVTETGNALEAARGYARTLVELDPENPEYAQLAGQLGSAKPPR